MIFFCLILITRTSMDVKMEVIQDKICVFEQSMEIDFDYEFDVAKYFDFTHFETVEEIAEAERWFDLAAGHPPSRPHIQRSKSMCTSQSNLVVSSRLLQPTASLLAKQNQHIAVHSKRIPTRYQKPGNRVKSPGEADATKRQKLDIGYLPKVAQLKHHTSFSHKSSKEVGTTDVQSCRSKLKVTVPKEPDLATTNRALRQRSNQTSHSGNDPRYHSSFRARPLNGKILEPQSSTQAKNRITTTLLQFQDKNSCGGMIADGCGMLELRSKADQAYNFRARPLNKKEFKLSNNKKLPQNPPTELFSKLYLISKNHSTSEFEEHPLQLKVLKKNASLSNMKENKNAGAITRKSMRCCGDEGRVVTHHGNHLTNIRSFAIH